MQKKSLQHVFMLKIYMQKKSLIIKNKSIYKAKKKKTKETKLVELILTKQRLIGFKQ